jgi:hypothetical protein
MHTHETYLAIRNGVDRSVLVSRGGRRENDVRFKRLDHEAWLFLLALSVSISVSIHDG